MKISEFIDTYSDDLLYLKDARHAFLTHPLRRDMRGHLDASLCRVAIVFSIGAVEAMLEDWRRRDSDSILKTYFAQGSSNGQRVLGLYGAFRNSGLQVNKEVFDDYLAIKYLRNTIMHSEWKRKETSWILERGFPADTRQLTREHLQKVEQVAQSMFLYIFSTSYAPICDETKFHRLGMVSQENTEVNEILSPRDLDAIIWNNLDRICSRIWRDIDETMDKAEFDWTMGCRRSEFEILGHSQRKRLYYIGARRLSLAKPELFSQSRVLARDALEFWQEYYRRRIAPNLKEERVDRALSVLKCPDFDPTNASWAIAGQIGRLNYDSALAIVRAILGRSSSLSPERVVDALLAGSLAYQIIPNISPIYLFSILLPIVDPGHTSEYCAEASPAYKMFLLNRIWYNCVESSVRFDEEDIQFPVRISKEFLSEELRQPGD